MENINITTHVDKKAFRGYLYWASFQSSIMAFVKLIGISAVLALVMTFIFEKSLTFFIGWTLIIMAVYILVIVVSNEKQLNEMDRIRNFPFLNKTATFTFDEESFRVAGKKYGYKQIFRLFSTKNLFCINYNNEKTFLIKKEDMTEAQINSIVAAVKERRI